MIHIGPGPHCPWQTISYIFQLMIHIELGPHCPWQPNGRIHQHILSHNHLLQSLYINVILYLYIDIIQNNMHVFVPASHSKQANGMRVTIVWACQYQPGRCSGSSWWRHQMETFSALLAICAGNSPVTSEFHAQRPVTRSFDVFFDLRLNKRFSKHLWGSWYETPSCPLRRHCNVNGWCRRRHFICTDLHVVGYRSDWWVGVALT